MMEGMPCRHVCFMAQPTEVQASSHHLLSYSCPSSLLGRHQIEMIAGTTFSCSPLFRGENCRLPFAFIRYCLICGAQRCRTFRDWISRQKKVVGSATHDGRGRLLSLKPWNRFYTLPTELIGNFLIVILVINSQNSQLSKMSICLLILFQSSFGPSSISFIQLLLRRLSTYARHGRVLNLQQL